MKDFLEGKGYKLWDSDKNHFGETNRFCKTLYDFYPNCECNDHVSVHINQTTWFMGNGREIEHTGVEINLAHKRQGGEWCNFDIHALTVEQLVKNIDKYESDLLELWTLFYNQGE